MKVTKSKSLILILIVLIFAICSTLFKIYTPISTASATFSGITNLTELTKSEQAQIDAQILKDWGTPTQFIELQDGFTEEDLNVGGWFYLTKDITANCSINPKATNNSIHLLLNGYTILGTFAISSTSQLNLYDKIPNQSGIEYRYNPNPIKYLMRSPYDKLLYNQYFTTIQPKGTNVTAMPNYDMNSYIKVSGSMITGSNGNLTFSDSGNLYGINVVGIQRNNDNVNLGFITLNDKAVVNLYQCNLVANENYILITNYTDSIALNCVGSNIYANSCEETKEVPYLAGASSAYFDIYGKCAMYKSNIGVVNLNNGNEDIAILQSFKDVNFGQRNKKITLENYDFYKNFSSIEGTIEIVLFLDIKLNSITLQYAGNSPNLNFIVLGVDSSLLTNEYAVKKNLLLTAGAVVNTIVVGGKGTIEKNADVNTILHDGKSGQYLDYRFNPIKNEGSIHIFHVNKLGAVTVQNSAKLNRLEIYASNYRDAGSLQPPSLPFYNENDCLGNRVTIDDGDNNGTDSSNTENGGTGGDNTENGGIGGNNTENGGNGSTEGDNIHNGNTAGGVDSTVLPTTEENKTFKIVTIVGFSAAGILVLIIVLLLLLWYLKNRRDKKIEEQCIAELKQLELDIDSPNFNKNENKSIDVENLNTLTDLEKDENTELDDIDLENEFDFDDINFDDLDLDILDLENIDLDKFLK